MSIVSRLTDRQKWGRLLSSLRYALYVIVHPFDGFWDLTHEKRGSVGAATLIILAVLVTRLIGLQHTSFLFSNVYWPEVNILQQCMSIILPLGIFVVGNWGLTTLFEGKGTLKDVYMMTGYALTPFVLIGLPMIFISNALTMEEAAFYDVFASITLIWCGALLLCGMMQVHDFGLAKTLLFTLLTLLAMVIIIFLLLLFFTLVGDGVGYFASIYREIVFRLY